MNKKYMIAGVVAVMLCGTSIGYALAIVVSEGLWPESWPKALEECRDQAYTFDGNFNAETFYSIPFTDQEQFEAMWTHILSLKSPGAPLILRKGPMEGAEGKVEAGVRIITPYQGLLEHPAAKTFTTPNLAIDLGQSMLEIPEYVIKTGDGWQTTTWESGRGRLERARVDIVLIVDGDIIDLNRIALPLDTPIIDKRFKNKQ